LGIGIPKGIFDSTGTYQNSRRGAIAQAGSHDERVSACKEALTGPLAWIRPIPLAVGWGDGQREPGADRSPLPISPAHTPHWSDGLARSEKNEPSDPTRKMNSRMSDSEVLGLIRSRVLWYFPVQAKRRFIIPIPNDDVSVQSHAAESLPE